MPDYRRARVRGGTYFFTLATAGRAPILTDCVELLGRALKQCRRRYPFEQTALVVLPDHLHALWTLPADDADFSLRWAAIKRAFTVEYLAGGNPESTVSRSRRAHRDRGVWQRRFWEHCVRDEADLTAHLHYIHYNPVKHGLVACPHAWPHSTFHRLVRAGWYEPDWACACDGRPAKAPIDLGNVAGEVDGGQ